MLRADKWILSEFLYRIISSASFLKRGAENMSGTVGLERVIKRFLQYYAFSLAPLAEQQRIVQKLDTLFARIDEAKKIAEKKIQSLDRLKDSLLGGAFENSL